MKPINKNNLSEYLRSKYGEGYKANLEGSNRLINYVTPLLQEDYGLAGDCTITSMTCILEYLYHRPIQEIYDIVEAIDKKYGYNGSFGTIPLLINRIFKQAEKQLGVNSVKWSSGYIKGLGFSFGTIVQQINLQHPLILSISNDGRGYYKSHSVTVVGYMVFRVNGKLQRFLRLQDNWNKEQTYLDFECLNRLCSINYYNE